MQKIKLLLGIALLSLVACKKQHVEKVAPAESDGAPPKENPRSLGAIPMDKQQYQTLINWERIGTAKTASCPSVDLTSMFPAPGQQGVQGSCVSWALGYAMKSYWEGIENGWALNTDHHITSPQYIYSQTHVSNVAGGGGSQMWDALNLLTSQGAATLDVSPYNPWDDFGFLNTPTEAMRQQAFCFRNSSWSALPFRDVDAIKDWLCNDHPVGLAFPVYPDFDNLDFTNDTYDNFNGTLRGWHAIALIGYDDTRQAFRFINSWDTWWGLGGYGWISYDLIANHDLEAYVMFDGPNAVLAEMYSSTSNAGIGTLGYYSGDVNGDGNTDVIHPWNNNGTLSIIAHDITSAPTSYLVNQTMNGHGATSQGFIPADVNGDGKTDLVQAWKNGNNMALSVFTSNGSSFTNTWNTTTGSGYQNVRLLPVDYNGDGKTDIAHLWNNNGSLGIVVYQSNGSSYSTVLSTTVPTGSVALGFIPADYDGDGKTDIVQVWNNNGSLGVIVIRSTGSNYSVAWNTTMGQGSPNVGFAPLDYDGDGKMDFVQGWNNGGKMNYIIYRSTGSSYVYQTNVATRQGTANLALLPQKRAASARTGVTQVWNNSTKTAFFRYDSMVY